METKAIRLLVPARVGKDLVPNNAVLDVEAAEADRVIGLGHAEATDALERYPNVPPPVHRFDDIPVVAGDRFPLPPNTEALYPPGLPRTEADRDTERAARARGPVRVEVPPPDRDRPEGP